jgi:histone H3/H4
MYDVGTDDTTRIQASAFEALQKAAEAFLVTNFESEHTIKDLAGSSLTPLVVLLAAIHGKRITVQKKDMELSNKLGFTMTGWKIGSI